LKVLVRTVWFAALLLGLLGGLIAVRIMVTAAPEVPDAQAEATAALVELIPGENTLTDADRSVPAPDADEAPLLPVESATVRLAHAEFKPPANAPKRIRTTSKQAKPRAAARQARMTDRSNDKTAETKTCRQLDPIARLLASANLARPCTG
jgi:hypothetical protein